MDIKSLLLGAHQILDEAQIDHALIGGLALGALGVQRFTNDVDFLINGEDRVKTKTAFSKFAYNVFFESEDILQLEGPGNVDFVLAHRYLSQEMLKRAMPLGNLEIKCLGAEDIIGLKIQAYINNPKREFQDKADIQGLIELHNNLDWKQIKKYADLFGEWLAIAQIRDKLK